MLLEKLMFEASNYVVELRFVAIKGRWVETGGPEGLIYVYAPMDSTKKKSFFEGLTKFVLWWGCHYMLGF